MIEATDDGVVVHVHVQPGAGRDGVVGQHGDALKIRVRARPTADAANAAVLSLLAEFFDVAPSSVEITGGLRSLEARAHRRPDRGRRARTAGSDPSTAGLGSVIDGRRAATDERGCE